MTEEPNIVDSLYLEAEHVALIAESQPPLGPRERVLPLGEPRRPFPGLVPREESAGPVRPDEEPPPVRTEWKEIERQGRTFNVAIEEYGHSPRRPNEEPT
ncbi:hypothetical protein [Streptomyces spinosus]|uniref:hypothetical protein n=1 Tax=Streptomyces spinosus TaxID=2872623 RepID=UPI001CEDD7BE|nr:hypothetical protein [Streptomyces spinosus]